jgi:PDZ domain-containing secreted protein
MNRATNIAKQRSGVNGFMTTEPGSNDTTNQFRTLVELAYEQDRTQGRHTAVAIAAVAKVSDTAVRKAFKAIKQVLSEGLLLVSGKYTDMAKTLMLSYFQRSESMNGAEWISELQAVVGAMPISNVNTPGQGSAEYWERKQRESMQQSTALATRGQAMLGYVQSQNDIDELGDDDAFEAELTMIRELSYERELRRRVAGIEGRNQARQDIKS